MPRVRTFRLRLPIDLLRSLTPLVSSAHDPTIRVRPHGVVRTLRSPDGPATIEVTLDERHARARAWGPGAAWALDHAPGLVGAADDPAGFDTSPHPAVHRAHRRLPGLRIVRTGLVSDVLVPTILAQRVTSGEAARSWTRIVRRWGEPAPGPHGLLLAPCPERLAGTPAWAFHRLGVERDRAVKIIAAARRLDRLQEAVDLSREQALRRLTALAGIGPWTAARVLRTAAGDPDVVEVGDFHLKHHVSWNLAGEPRGSDERMLELLAPFAGHRGRVVRLLMTAGQRPPGFGPRRRVIPVDAL